MPEIARHTLQRLADRAEIQDALCRYARAVDRGDWDLLRTTYHPDAYDDHFDYKGDLEGLVKFLDERFASTDNSTHFLGNCLIEFGGIDVALVETYFASRRLRSPSSDEMNALQPGDMICRQAWGRYLDRFERRNGDWRVARRVVALESRFTSVAKQGARDSRSTWGARDGSDLLYAMHAEILDGKSR